MKLTQQEFCHNCNRYVTFEFDDVTERQVIICPNCGHEHWRELDSTQILNLRLYGKEQIIYTAHLPPLNLSINETDGNNSIQPMNTTIKKSYVVGQTEDGRAIVENEQKRISERRWGRDQRQRG